MYSFQTTKLDIFHTKWKEAESLAVQHGVYGYMEGEHVFSSDSIDCSKQQLDSEFIREWKPFRAIEGLVPLDVGFKQTEIHLYWRREGSPDEVWQKLSELGMVIVVMPANGHNCLQDVIVATMQGWIPQIRHIKEILIGSFRPGGIQDVEIEEEVMIAHRFLGGYTTVNLPKIVTSVIDA